MGVNPPKRCSKVRSILDLFPFSCMHAARSAFYVREERRRVEKERRGGGGEGGFQFSRPKAKAMPCVA